MTQKQNEDLQIILNEMFASKDELSLKDVEQWQKKYPQFSREIVDAYADWRDFELFVLDDKEASIIDEQISAENKKKIENLMAQFRPQSVEAITDLRELAEKQGVKRETLRKKLGISETLMRKIERRNLKEIPRLFENKIAEILSIAVESLRTFFDLPSALPKAARFKSKNTPQTLPKQSFAEAVRNDPELSDEEKQKLLNLE